MLEDSALEAEVSCLWPEGSIVLSHSFPWPGDPGLGPCFFLPPMHRERCAQLGCLGMVGPCTWHWGARGAPAWLHVQVWVC